MNLKQACVENKNIIQMSDHIDKFSRKLSQFLKDNIINKCSTKEMCSDQKC